MTHSFNGDKRTSLMGLPESRCESSLGNCQMDSQTRSLGGEGCRSDVTCHFPEDSPG